MLLRPNAIGGNGARFSAMRGACVQNTRSRLFVCYTMQVLIDNAFCRQFQKAKAHPRDALYGFCCCYYFILCYSKEAESEWVKSHCSFCFFFIILLSFIWLSFYSNSWAYTSTCDVIHTFIGIYWLLPVARCTLTKPNQELSAHAYSHQRNTTRTNEKKTSFR